MNPAAVEALLDAVRKGELGVDAALAKLRALPYEAVGDEARVDHHRELRSGSPEVIFGQGKTPQQIADIAARLLGAGSNVLCTRATREAFLAVSALASDATWDELSRCLVVKRRARAAAGPVAVLCAGTSDLPVAREALETLRFYDLEPRLFADVGVAGLHRLLAIREELLRHRVLIVVAGLEGALPSVVGGLMPQPVIAVPTSVGYGASFGGLAALLGMLNSCAAGVTVVNIDNGFGAAAAAQRLLGPAGR